MFKYTIKTTALTEHIYEEPEWEFETAGLKGSNDAAYFFRNNKDKTTILYPAANVVSLEIKGKK